MRDDIQPHVVELVLPSLAFPPKPGFGPLGFKWMLVEPHGLTRDDSASFVELPLHWLKAHAQKTSSTLRADPSFMRSEIRPAKSQDKRKRHCRACAEREQAT